MRSKKLEIIIISNLSSIATLKLVYYFKQHLKKRKTSKISIIASSLGQKQSYFIIL